MRLNKYVYIFSAFPIIFPERLAICYVLIDRLVAGIYIYYVIRRICGFVQSGILYMSVDRMVAKKWRMAESRAGRFSTHDDDTINLTDVDQRPYIDSMEKRTRRI